MTVELEAEEACHPDRDAPYLRIERITKYFGQFRALSDVSLSIDRGEFVVFLGPSGCGKTTLLRIIAGLEIQSGGLIYQAGLEISALPPTRRDFGIVFQSYALFPNLSVRDNIGYGLRSKGLGRQEIAAQVTELLELIGLSGEGNKYPSRLSGGQQQRVAVARALATQPGLLLLDEPLSALDARVRIHMRTELKRLQRRFGLTAVMVTHDQSEALTMADRIVVMNQGVVEQVGSPLEIYQHSTSRFVADFIGTMNFLTAELLDSEAARVGEQVFHCNPPAGLRAGAAALAVRAEDVVLGAAAGDGLNTFVARIEEIEFNGSFCRVTLLSPLLGDAPLLADVPIHIFREGEIAPRREIRVGIPRELIRVFGR